MSPELSIVIPAFNESAVLSPLLTRLTEVMEGLRVQYEIVIVDDGSRDATWDEIKTHVRSIAGLRGLRLSRNFGKESAICAGLSTALGRAVVLMDADLQHPPELIPEMVAAWREGFLVVDGLKRTRGQESWISRLGARAFYYLLGSLADFDLRGASDFKLLDRSVVEAWRQMGERNVFFRGMSAWAGFTRTSVEFDVAERSAGTSTWSRPQLFSLALRAITAFSSVPLRVVTIVGIVFLVAAFALAVQTLYMKLTGAAFTGFTTVILLILVSSSCLMLALGILGEYMARIYEEVKQRPRYLIEARCGGDAASVEEV